MADPKATSQILFVLASVLLAGAIVGQVYATPPDKQFMNSQSKSATKKEEAKAMAARSAAVVAQTTVVTQTWTDEPAVIKGQIVALTATLAKNRHVRWVSINPPPKAVVDSGLEQYAFMLQVEGSFPNVVALERDLEQPANRLAVNSFQATSSNSESDAVSASIGLIAHRVIPDTGVEKDKTNGKR